MNPHAPGLTLVERRVMDVERRFMNEVDPENVPPVTEQKECWAVEVEGPSSNCELWDDETPDVLSQSKVEPENERHCLKGDGAEKLNFDF